MQSELRDLPKIVVVGSCSVDFTVYTQRLPLPGETIHGNKFNTSYGGKGANQCVAAAKLGGNTYMIARLGDDIWGKQYKEYLKGLEVDVTYTHLTKNITTGIAQISVAEDGENQIVIVPGSNGHLSKSDIDDAKKLIETADLLIAQLETPLETTLEAFKLNKGIKLLNAAPARADIENILPLCTILCVNEHEATLLVKFNVDISNIKLALEKLLEKGCEIVIITLGDKGAAYACKESKEYIQVTCDKVTPIETTGAGDAFVGALGKYLVSKKDLPFHQIVGAACEVATISVTKEGTQTSYPQEHCAFKNEYPYLVL